MCLWEFHLGFIVFGTLWVSCTWLAISSPVLGKFSTIISSSISSCPLFLFSSSGTLIIQMLGHLTLSFQRSLRLSSFLLVLFFFLFFFPLCFIYFHHSIFYLTYPISCLSYSTIVSLQSAFDLLLHYSLLIDSFISSRSLLNFSCIVSIVSSMFFCNSILFSEYWIIFTIIILNSFSGRLPISSSFVWFGVHLSCSFTCWIFLCLFILFILLYLGWAFCMLEVCGFSLLWHCSCVWCWIGLVACQGFLVREVCVCVLVGEAGSLLSGVQ